MNGMMLQSFQWDLEADGTHWKRLNRMALELSRMGFTGIWLPPAYKGAAGGMDVGYGVYDLYDLGEFDQKGSVRTKYGTAEEYISAVRAMRHAGLQTMADTVLNHRLGADGTERVPVRRVSPDQRMQIDPELREGEVYTDFRFSGRGGAYSDFRWNHSCFTAVDYNALDPEGKLFLLEDKQWAQDVDTEHQNYDYLMGADVDVLNQQVQQELVRWAVWYQRRTGVEGFRLDAVKHISASFYRNWLKALRETTGKEMYAVGEYWHPDVGVLLGYLDRVDNAMDLFDVPLHFHLREASSSGGAYDMRGLWRGTLTEAKPVQAVTFVDNHDTQPGQSLESWVEGWFKGAAYAMILLRAEGYPCVFWGDLYGIPSRGIGAVSELQELMNLRLRAAYGEQRDYFDDPHLVGFTRAGEAGKPDSGLAFLCTNERGGHKRMEVGREHAGELFLCTVGRQQHVRIDAEGWGDFSVPDGAFAVWAPAATWQTALRRLCRDAGLWLRYQWRSLID